jgi:hypothetical protein
MYATMRQYAGITPAVVDTWISHQADIEALHRQVSGFVQYDLVRTDSGLTTLTVCKDRVGAEIANLNVAAWIEVNLPAMLMTTPVIIGGEHILHVSA